MAKVKTEKYGYTVNGAWKHYIKTVTINPATGEMTIVMPEEVAVATGVAEVEARTLTDVEKKFREVMTDYASCTIETTKVILYRFDYFTNSLEPDHYIHHNSGIMIEMFAGVFNEHKGTAKSGKVTWKYELLESPLEYPVRDYEANSRDWEQFLGRLVWTQELEDFFRSTQEGMQGIVSKLKELSTPAQLAEFAYSRPLLSGPNNNNQVEVKSE